MCRCGLIIEDLAFVLKPCLSGLKESAVIVESIEWERGEVGRRGKGAAGGSP